MTILAVGYVYFSELQFFAHLASLRIGCKIAPTFCEAGTNPR